MPDRSSCSTSKTPFESPSTVNTLTLPPSLDFPPTVNGSHPLTCQ
ncbi:hypothetical protein A2U01_0115955, partial [Trifolium medium]|nr:hypothetical protein [Trifolium medium]